MNTFVSSYFIKYMQDSILDDIFLAIKLTLKIEYEVIKKLLNLITYYDI